MKKTTKMRTTVLSLIVTSLFLGFIPAASHAGGSWNGWIYQDPYPTSVNLFDVKFVAPTKGWIVGKYGSIFFTEDGGDTWEAQESGTEEGLMRVAFVNEKTGWAVGERGTIVHTENGGKTWVTQYNAKAFLTKVFFINEKDGWVTGSTPAGVVYHTRDGGKTWQKVDTGISRAIGSVFFVNLQTGWILAGEDIYRTADGGKSWAKSKLPISELPMNKVPGARNLSMNPTGEGLGFDWWYGDIAFANGKQGWAVVNRWYVFHTEDGGKTWTTQLDTGYMSFGFSHISFRDAQNGCVSGSTIYCTEDGGTTWQERLGVRPGDGRGLGGISLTGRSDGWVVGNAGWILKTEDSGRSWKHRIKGTKCGGEPFYVDKKTGWLYDSRNFNELCRTDDGGHTWEKQDIGMKVWDVFFADNSTGWAVGLIEEWKDGKETNTTSDRINVWGVIKHTTDGGKTWETQYKESMGKAGFPGLSGLSFINRTIGWVVGKGTILHTEDGGRHWKHQKNENVDLYLNKVHFIDAKAGWIAGAQVKDGWTGIILHTEDGGKHWKIQHKLRDVGFEDDLQFIDNKSGWISGQTEYGEVGVLLRTEDGGKTWSKKEFENIGNNHMAFLDKDRGVICSAGVLKTGLMVITVDGGKTWNKRRVPLKKYPWYFSDIFETQVIK